MKTVKEIIEKKGSDVFSISPHDTVFDALKMMSDKDVGALLVIEDEKLVGILSERDYARRIILMDRASKTTTVSELMTRNVLYVTPEKTLEDCMVIMASKKIRHLPVMENEKLMGLISSTDVVRNIISEQKSTIDALEKYISSSL
jgi:CBS domain-containing protein